MANKRRKFFSDLGRSLMLPIATLAASGLMMGFSSALLKPEIQRFFPFLQWGGVVYFLEIIRKITGGIFGVIPVLFAITIPIGMVEEDKEIAGFAGFVGYYSFILSASMLISTDTFDVTGIQVSNILGVEGTLDMGVIAGMMVGLVTAYLHDKYHDIVFPSAIAFYGGNRFVAIVVIMVMIILGQVTPYLWRPLSKVIFSIGELIGKLKLFGVFVFGFLERLLIPTGLHHILNSIMRTTPVGGTYKGVDGALNIFYEFFDKVNVTQLRPYTQFLGQGKMPFMIFGLPAAAYAIYETTDEESKEKVKSLMIAAAMTSAISGITEPLEFSFMFVAPKLFLVHAIFAGFSFASMSFLKVAIGHTGGGIIDFFIYGVLVPRSRWWLILVVGPVFSLLYYKTFKYYLEKHTINIIEDTGSNFETESIMVEDNLYLLVEALGGVENILRVENCMSRLRLDIRDISLIDEVAIKKTGSMGIVRVNNEHIQIIYGPKVEKVSSDLKRFLKKTSVRHK